MREGWTYKKLGECFPYIKNGANIKQIKGAKGYPITRIETLSGGVFNRDRMGYADIFDINKYQDYILENGDLLMSHINSKTYIGRTVQYIYQDNEVIIHGMNLLRLRSNESVILSSFFKFYTDSWHFKTDIASIRKDAVNQSSFAISDLKNFKVPIPSLSEQQYIVAELDKINELISLKKAQLSDLDSLAQSIFYDMFGDPIENEKGWEVKKLKDIVADDCSISYGIVQPGDGVNNGVPVVRPVDMTHTFVKRSGLKHTTKEISDSYKRTILKGNEILICVRGTTGLVALATEDLKGCNVTRGVSPIECNALNNRLYVYHQLLTDGIQHYIANYTKGIALKQINMQDVREIPLIIPPLSLQQEFAKRIELIEQQKAQICSTIKDLETLLASRMQYWFD